jgi:hypothetical protein
MNKRIAIVAITLALMALAACSAPAPVTATPTAVPTTTITPTEVPTSAPTLLLVLPTVEAPTLEASGSCTWTEQEIAPGTQYSVTDHIVVVVTWSDGSETSTGVSPIDGKLTINSTDGATVKALIPAGCNNLEINQVVTQWTVMSPDDLQKSGVITGTRNPGP